MSSSKPTDIAIVGGGFAGLALAVGLQKYPHINVQVYEGAHEFSEVGAGVVLGPNAQRAMTMIHPTIKEGYDRRAGFAVDPPDENGLYPWMTLIKGQAPDVDELVIQYKHPTQGSTIHRAHLLEELVKLIEPGRAHFGKRLDHVYETDDRDSPIVLHFGDGTTASTDIVIGADGVHSGVRKHILGADDPAAHAFFTGSIVYRATVPIEVARAKLGDIQQMASMRMGKNGMVFGFPLANLTRYYLGVTTFDNGPWEHEKWIVSADVEDAKRRFAEWDDYARKQVELLPADGSTMGWSVWDMSPASTYYKGRVAIMGDAAHASTPFQGAGAGQAIEDALILEQLLGKYLDPAARGTYPSTVQRTVPLILQAYDTVRRLRSQKVVTVSREMGRIISCNEPGVGDTATELRKALEHRQRWIWDIDQQQQVKDAFQIYESIRAAGERPAPNHPK